MYFTKCILLFYYIQCISKEGGRDKDGREDKDGIVVVVVVAINVVIGCCGHGR